MQPCVVTDKTGVSLGLLYQQNFVNKRKAKVKCPSWELLECSLMKSLSLFVTFKIRDMITLVACECGDSRASTELFTEAGETFELKV